MFAVAMATKLRPLRMTASRVIEFKICVGKVLYGYGKYIPQDFALDVPTKMLNNVNLTIIFFSVHLYI